MTLSGSRSPQPSSPAGGPNPKATDSSWESGEHVSMTSADTSSTATRRSPRDGVPWIR